MATVVFFSKLIHFTYNWQYSVLETLAQRVSVKPGLWTGLDYGLDWTDQNSYIQTANATKATTACIQLCLKLPPSLLRHNLLDFWEVKGHMHIQ